MVATPFATHILSQLGAAVIKVEPPTGDATRALVRGGPGGTLIAYSHGKKSIAINLPTSDGGDVLRASIAAAGVMDDHRIDGRTSRLGPL